MKLCRSVALAVKKWFYVSKISLRYIRYIYLLLEQESDGDYQNLDVDDEGSDTGASVCVEEREENSVSEFSDFFASEKNKEENTTYYILVQCCSKWMKMAKASPSTKKKKAHSKYCYVTT